MAAICAMDDDFTEIEYFNKTTTKYHEKKGGRFEHLAANQDRYRKREQRVDKINENSINTRFTQTQKYLCDNDAWFTPQTQKNLFDTWTRNEPPIPKTCNEQLSKAVYCEGKLKITLGTSGASLLVPNNASKEPSNLSISKSSREEKTTCSSQDRIKRGTCLSMYTLMPHRVEFVDPVTITIPYNSTAPKERLGVFFMNVDQLGNPTGKWTNIHDVQFNESTAVFNSLHFSYYAVFEFPDVSLQRRATVTRTENEWEAVRPGLAYRGKCGNPACKVFNKVVNCNRGFGVFYPAHDADFGSIKCPKCGVEFVNDRFVLFDTKADIKWCKEDKTKDQQQFIASDSEVIAFGINPDGETGTAKYTSLIIKAEPTRESCISIDVCFAMDCTGSMASFIKAGKDQIKLVVNGLTEGLKKLGLTSNLRLGFVAYRDFKPGYFFGYSAPRNLLEVVSLTEDVDRLVNVVSSQHAEGGEDGPEHIVGALKEAVSMDWSAETRVFVLIGDAPCHGREFHNMQDSFPHGDPSGLHPSTFLQQMAEKNIHFFFMKIKDATNIMIDKFQGYYNNNSKSLKLEVLNMGNDPNIMGTLVQAGIMKKIEDEYI